MNVDVVPDMGKLVSVSFLSNVSIVLIVFCHRNQVDICQRRGPMTQSARGVCWAECLVCKAVLLAARLAINRTSHVLSVSPFCTFDVFAGSDISLNQLNVRLQEPPVLHARWHTWLRNMSLSPSQWWLTMRTSQVSQRWRGASKDSALSASPSQTFASTCAGCSIFAWEGWQCRTCSPSHQKCATPWGQWLPLSVKQGLCTLPYQPLSTSARTTTRVGGNEQQVSCVGRWLEGHGTEDGWVYCRARALARVVRSYYSLSSSSSSRVIFMHLYYTSVPLRTLCTYYTLFFPTLLYNIVVLRCVWTFCMILTLGPSPHPCPCLKSPLCLDIKWNRIVSKCVMIRMKRIVFSHMCAIAQTSRSACLLCAAVCIYSCLGD